MQQRPCPPAPRNAKHDDAQWLFAEQSVHRLPPDIQQRARLRLQRVVAVAALTDLRCHPIIEERQVHLLRLWGSGACDSPKLDARRLEEMVVGKIRSSPRATSAS